MTVKYKSGLHGRVIRISRKLNSRSCTEKYFQSSFTDRVKIMCIPEWADSAILLSTESMLTKLGLN